MKKSNSIDEYTYRILVATSLLMIGGGTVFYHIVEKWTYINSFYFSVVTLATVGYGDLVPKTDFGKVFTSFYILVGVGIIATFASALVKHRGIKAKTKYEEKHKQ